MYEERRTLKVFGSVEDKSLADARREAKKLLANLTDTHSSARPPPRPVPPEPSTFLQGRGLTLGPPQGFKNVSHFLFIASCTLFLWARESCCIEKIYV
jgi:hypothetical protein